MKYLITGKNGQLAQAFIKTLNAKSEEFSAPEESHFDITDAAKADDVVQSYRPGVIINCAAYNFVDKAEEERERASSVNADGPKILAAAAKRYGAFLVHFSSDYVFDGLKETGPYVEDDEVQPLNEYGKSKLRGEQLVRQETDAYLCFRLSWVFGEGRQNFIYKLLEWSKGTASVKIACDEFSVPTYTQSVVDITLQALRRGLTGLYHLTNSGYCSRYEWAKFVFNTMGIAKFIRPVSMESFHLSATRPKFSAMSNERLARSLGIDIPSWEEGVRACIADGGTYHA